MKLGIIGSRNIPFVDLEAYVIDTPCEIVSGGAKGIDTVAKVYAIKKGIKYTEFLPEYDKYRKAAPLKRNDRIIEYCDRIIAFWDGNSKGTQYVIKQCKKIGKPITVYTISL